MSARGFRSRRVVLAALALALFGQGVPMLAWAESGAALSPAQAAFLRAESKRIEDNFVARVAAIVAVSPDRVRRAMPDERRITSTVARLISALEQDLGAPLGDGQRAAIKDADQARLGALARVREGASRR